MAEEKVAAVCSNVNAFLRKITILRRDVGCRFGRLVIIYDYRTIGKRSIPRLSCRTGGLRM